VYAVGLLFLGSWLWLTARGKPVELVAVHRNFFGVLRVWDSVGVRFLIHGQIEHGSQALSDDLRKTPIGYFSPMSGAGRVLAAAEGPRSIGVVGLGVGTLAAYGRPGDRIRFYEINPAVKEIALTHFYYLNESEAADRIEFSLGDGRLSLEREDPQRFDVLVIDAFNSDSVPTHLLTIEAFEIYLKHLADRGILCVQVSNRHFDLVQVVRGAARYWNLWMVKVQAPRDEEQYLNESKYVLLARSAEPLQALGLEALEDPTDSDPDLKALRWTDQYSNLFGAMYPIWNRPKAR
jgi:hypothetical protein